MNLSHSETLPALAGVKGVEDGRICDTHVPVCCSLETDRQVVSLLEGGVGDATSWTASQSVRWPATRETVAAAAAALPFTALAPSSLEHSYTDSHTYTHRLHTVLHSSYLRTVYYTFYMTHTLYTTEYINMHTMVAQYIDFSV